MKKLVRVGDHYINKDAITYIHGASRGGPYSGKDVTKIYFIGTWRPLIINMYIDEVRKSLDEW